MLGAAALAGVIVLGQVQLRGGVVVDAPVEGITMEGVRVGGDAPRTIGWDRVLILPDEFGEAATPYSLVADAAWRARTRLARGDVRLAEPLFEQLFEQYRGGAGPTSLVVAEGLLRCRLSRGAQAGAVEPWIATLRIRAGGERLAGEPPLPPALDDETGLAPALPPIWLDTPALEALLRRDADVGAGDPVAGAMWAWSRYAAALERGEATDPPETEADDHPGVALVRRIALSRSPDAATRAAARAELEAGLDESRDTWAEAWRRAAIGRSLLLEDERDATVRAVVELLHLPARFASAQPWLAGVALAEASRALRDLGDDAGAERLRDELRRLDPSHPALDWLERRDPTTRAGRRAGASPGGSMHADS